jgi:hypothetical protein
MAAQRVGHPPPVPYANLTNPQTLNLYAMVSDNPESFADLDGHCGVIIPGAPAATRPCNNTNPNGPDDEGEGNAGIAALNCSLASCDTAAEVSAQSTQIAAQEAANQQTQFVLIPSIQEEKPTGGPNQNEQKVDYTLGKLDSQGEVSNLTPADGDHFVTLHEKLTKGDSKNVGICNSCTDRNPNKSEDTMQVTAGNPHSVEKRFTIDKGTPVKVYDPKSKKAYDYVRVDAKYTGNKLHSFKMTFGND